MLMLRSQKFIKWIELIYLTVKQTELSIITVQEGQSEIITFD